MMKMLIIAPWILLLGASCRDQIGELCEVNFKFNRVRCLEYNFTQGYGTERPARDIDFKNAESIIGVSTEFYFRELTPKIKEMKQKIKDQETELGRCRFLGL